jgi:uncharacterized membrane protein YeiH
MDSLGTMVFSISGAMTAYDKKMDLFGISAVAFITALGGGTLRDLLIGSTPVSWMINTWYLLMVFSGIILAMIFKPWIFRLKKTFFLFDTVGIAVFTVIGLNKSLDIGLQPIVAVMMGMVSAVFGGVIRDIVCNEIPLIFRKEIYALTCITGGFWYIGLSTFSIDKSWLIISTVLLIISFRFLSVRYHWQLPGTNTSNQ